MKKKLLLILILITGFSNFLLAQSPYTVYWKKEIPYVATAVGLNLGGAYLASQINFLTPAQIAALDANGVNSFDRFATDNFSTTFARASNVLEVSTQLAPLLFLCGNKTRRPIGQIMALYVEASFINTGLTIVTKMTFRRTRPFVYNPEVPLEEKTGRTARASFISGHTSTAAVGTFFTAKVFSDFFPDSKWKPVVWGAAATIPAVMGYFRVAAGKHFPTDVIGGYLVGGAIGILVPHLHKKRGDKESKLGLNIGFNSAQLVLRLGK